MVKPSDITWEILEAARPEIERLRGQMTVEAYEEDKRSLQTYLCNYFNSDDGKGCDAKQGKAISPVGFATGQGGKCLKVRWALPGRGKSGGLRLAVVTTRPTQPSPTPWPRLDLRRARRRVVAELRAPYASSS